MPLARSDVSPRAPLSRVVWVTEEASATPRAGGGIRSLRLIQALARTAEVHVVAVDTVLDADDYLRAAGVASVSCFSPTPLTARARAAALVRLWPQDFARRYSAGAHRHVSDLLTAPGSVLVVEHLRTVVYRSPRSPYVLALQNADAELARAACADATGWRRGSAALEFRLSQLQQRRATRDPRAHVVVVSAVDAALVGGRTTVVPNGADVPSSPPPLPPGGNVLFIGSLTYGPNLDAVRWWAEEVWPATPGLPPLRVVGRGGRDVLGPLARVAAVEVVGEVERVDDELAAAAICVVPIRHGSGSRLKLLEALAWGRPVVTTSKGAEGIPVEDGVDVIEADDPVAFGRAVRALLDDPASASRLGRAGRARAMEYSWDGIGDTFVEVVRAAAGRGRSG